MSQGKMYTRELTGANLQEIRKQLQPGELLGMWRSFQGETDLPHLENDHPGTFEVLAKDFHNCTFVAVSWKLTPPIAS